MQTARGVADATGSYVEQVGAEERFISPPYLSLVARKFASDIARLAKSIEPYAGDVAADIARVVDGRNLMFRKAAHDHCLDEEGDRTLINCDFVDKQIAAATRGARVASLADGCAQRALMRDIIRTEVRLLLAHEFYHSEQGLPSIESARGAIRVLGHLEFSKFDVIADFRAAVIDAAMSALDDGVASYTEVLDRFAANLAFTLRYNAPIFGAPSDKPHKRARFASKVLQLARISAHRANGRGVDRAAFLKLTAPIFVSISQDLRLLAIVGLEPARFLGSFEFEPGELQPMFDKLDTGHVDDLIKDGIVVAAQVGFLGVEQ
jgi:hypothetical protein